MIRIKKIMIRLYMVLILLCLSGCNTNDDESTTKNGTYTFKQIGTELEFSAYVTISDDNISFSYDLLSSYLPYGSYTIKNDILTMKTYDEIYQYVFKIDNDSLFFQKKESSSVKLIDDKFGVEIADNAEFKFQDN